MPIASTIVSLMNALALRNRHSSRSETVVDPAVLGCRFRPRDHRDIAVAHQHVEEVVGHADLRRLRAQRVGRPRRIDQEQHGSHPAAQVLAALADLGQSHFGLGVTRGIRHRSSMPSTRSPHDTAVAGIAGRRRRARRRHTAPDPDCSHSPTGVIKKPARRRGPVWRKGARAARRLALRATCCDRRCGCRGPWSRSGRSCR